MLQSGALNPKKPVLLAYYPFRCFTNKTGYGWGHQTTNLGVGSSNLFGRAKEIRNLEWFCPIDTGPFA